jgi:hypothetical protein
MAVVSALAVVLLAVVAMQMADAPGPHADMPTAVESIDSQPGIPQDYPPSPTTPSQPACGEITQASADVTAGAADDAAAPAAPDTTGGVVDVNPGRETTSDST